MKHLTPFAQSVYNALLEIPLPASAVEVSDHLVAQGFGPLVSRPSPKKRGQVVLLALDEAYALGLLGRSFNPDSKANDPSHSTLHFLAPNRTNRQENLTKLL